MREGAMDSKTTKAELGSAGATPLSSGPLVRNNATPIPGVKDPKPIYEELGRNYRFFAGWRHLTFAAGAAIWAGVISVGADKTLHSEEFALTALAAGFGQLILLLIDARSRELITAAQKHGVELEKPSGGYFTAVDEDPKWPSHTFIGRLFYITSAVALFLLAIAA